MNRPYVTYTCTVNITLPLYVRVSLSILCLVPPPPPRRTHCFFLYTCYIVAGSFGMGSGQGGVQLSAAQQMQHQQLVRNQPLSGSPVSQMQMISQQQSLGLQSAPVPTSATQVTYTIIHRVSGFSKSERITAVCEMCHFVVYVEGWTASVV
jgi:hypothetical protein